MLRAAHGRARNVGAGGPRVEVMPASGLPAPVPAPLRPCGCKLRGRPRLDCTAEHVTHPPRVRAPRVLPVTPTGELQPAVSAVVLQPVPETFDPLKVPGATRARHRSEGIVALLGPMPSTAPPSGPHLGRVALARHLIPTTEAFRPYRSRATSFRKAQCASLADVAGGECGPGPSSMIATAATQLAVSRYLYDLALSADTPDPLLLREARQQGDSSRQNLLAAYELAVREAQRRGKRDIDPLDLIEAKQRANARESQLNHPHDGL